VTFTITLHNTGAPAAGTISMTNTLPVELTYKPGTLSADFGSIDDTNSPNLQWAGAPSNRETVTITFDATVATTDAELITNTAVFDAGSDGSFTVSAALIANGHATYLPIIHK
ncbi:MAG: DUF11 domain-containing protein, partial [Chloroflexi bacterium]|nr:DUF11 domain-containing protein [Chloroflexota bacterium]